MSFKMGNPFILLVQHFPGIIYEKHTQKIPSFLAPMMAFFTLVNSNLVGGNFLLPFCFWLSSANEQHPHPDP